MTWPLSQDYNEAIQSPARNFADPDLKRGAVATNALGLPMPYSGNFADVYEVRCPDGSRWAVKCFTREVPGLRQRYEAISRHLLQAKLPFTVDFSYLEEGIRVAGRWFPALKMEWVEGLTLNQFVARAADKPATLEALLQVWARMGQRLRAAEVAHCDLQHGNVLLVPGSGSASLALKLVDYDGLWVPALAGSQSGEVGHPSYQHPRRAPEGTYSLEVDRFPLLLVATALRALKAGGRPLWEKYDNGDNLLFTEADLLAPTKSTLFLDLIRSADPPTATLANRLFDALRGGVESAPLLEEVMPEARPAPAPSGVRERAAVATAAPRTRRSDLEEVGGWADVAAASRARQAEKTKTGVPLAAWVGGAAALIVVLGAVGAFFLMKGSGPSAEPTSPLLVEKRSDSGKKPGRSDAEGSPIKPKNEPGSAKEGPGSAPVDQPLPEVKPEPKEPTPEVKKPEQKPAVPDEAALADAKREAKDVYKAEYARKTPADMQALASRLLKGAAETTKDRPAARFVLLREARDLAARAGDVKQALRAAEELANQFAVDVLEMKAVALETAGHKGAAAAAHLDVAVSALDLSDQAEEGESYQMAERLAKAAQSSAVALAGLPVATAAQARAKETAAIRTAFESVSDAAQVLTTRPDDADANLALGRFHALTRGDWDRGLGLLARGSDPKLKTLAETDLASPADAGAAADLGDAYSERAAAESDTAKTNLLCRAYYWYGQAALKLAGIDRARVEKKRAPLEKMIAAQRPVILHARYGAYKGWPDVTAQLRWLVVQARGQKVTFKKSQVDLGIPDPSFGEYKSLVVVYRHGGGIYLSIGGDEEVAIIPAPPGSADVEPGRPGPGQGLVILHARYGNEGRYADATAKTQAAVSGSTLAASPDQLGLGDPYPGRHKSFIIVYRDAGRVRLSVTAQEDTVRLGAGAAKP